MSSSCVVTTLQAPLQETLMFVNYHLNIGVDHIYLFLTTRPTLQRTHWRDGRASHAVRCDLEYWNSHQRLFNPPIDQRTAKR